MRFLFKDAERVRRLAKLLRSELSASGHEWPLSRCRQATAEACGYPNFHEAEASAGRDGASVVDDGCDPATVEARRTQQVDALVRQGLPHALAEDVVGRVGFTRARRHLPATPVPREPTARQMRIDQRGGGGRGMRAGNFDGCCLVSPSGEFLGVCIGTDMAYEHDGAPEGLLEAFGVAEGARTVGEARMTATADVVLSIPDVGGGSPDLGLVLWLNYDMEEARVFNRLDREMRITRARFAREEYDRPWRSNAIDDSNGFVAGWGYDRAAFVGFDQESRERIGLLNVAVVDNGLAFAFSRRSGLYVLLADRFDQDRGLNALVGEVEATRFRLGGGGHPDVVVDVPAPAPMGPG